MVMAIVHSNPFQMREGQNSVAANK